MSVCVWVRQRQRQGEKACARAHTRLETCDPKPWTSLGVSLALLCFLDLLDLEGGPFDDDLPKLVRKGGCENGRARGWVCKWEERM